ncbi:MAG: VWA domain-containing protein [Burkholderiales bacterium]
MKFDWPEMLWLLLAVPLLVVGYIWLLRRRKKGALRFASLGLIKEAMGPAQRIRRHVPPALFLIAMIIAIFGIARPNALIMLPSQQQTIVMAMDVSLSMRATDVEPNRISAAQVAAKAFVEEQPPNLKIGIVTFAGTATVVQTPTRSKEDLIAAIDRFQLQRATATGSGLIVALATLFPNSGIDLESWVFGNPSSRAGAARSAPLDGGKKTEQQPFKPVPPGSYSSGAIILLSDGRRTTGPDPLEVAKMVADRGVRVYTVGFGTLEGGVIGFGGWSAYVRLDEETLKAIAEITKGEYFYAGTAADLKKVYQALTAKLVLEKRHTEITGFFGAAAALFAAIAGLLSLLWFNRSL